MDYCCFCLRSMCSACMKSGCCKHTPAMSGEHYDRAGLPKPVLMDRDEDGDEITDPTPVVGPHSGMEEAKQYITREALDYFGVSDVIAAHVGNCYRHTEEMKVISQYTDDWFNAQIEWFILGNTIGGPEGQSAQHGVGVRGELYQLWLAREEHKRYMQLILGTPFGVDEAPAYELGGEG